MALVNQKLIDFIHEVYSSWTKLKQIIADYPQLRAKVDGLKPGGSGGGTSPQRSGSGSADPEAVISLKVTSVLSGARGKYLGVRGRWVKTVSESADFTFEESIVWDTAEVVIVDFPESTGDAASHRMAAGQVLDGVAAKVPSSSGKPVYRVDFGRRAIADIRISPAGDWIQVSYVPDPTLDDWVNKIPVTGCTSTPTVQLMELMRGTE